MKDWGKFKQRMFQFVPDDINEYLLSSVVMPLWRDPPSIPDSPEITQVILRFLTSTAQLCLLTPSLKEVREVKLPSLLEDKKTV